jgi:hypothetical protein
MTTGMQPPAGPPGTASFGDDAEDGFREVRVQRRCFPILREDGGDLGQAGSAPPCD